MNFYLLLKMKILSGQKLLEKFKTFFKISSLKNFDEYFNKRTSIDLFFENINFKNDSIEFTDKRKK